MAVDFTALVLNSCIDIFGDPVTYLPAAGGSLQASGVFDPAYSEVVVLDGMPVTQTMPVLGIKLIDFPAMPLQHDTLIVQGNTYVVRDVRVDGQGGAKLMLNYVSGQ